MAKYCVYTDESGLTYQEKYMLIWMLFIPMDLHSKLHNDLKNIFAKAKWQERISRNKFIKKLIENNELEKIQKILRNDKNAFEMKFSNVKAVNMDFYENFIDIIFHSWVIYGTFIIDKNIIDKNLSKWDLFVSRYAKWISEKIFASFNKNDEFFIMSDELNTPKWETLFEDKLNNMIANNGIFWITTVSSHASLFSQVCDLLLGCSTSRMREINNLSQQKDKIDFQNYVSKKIGINIDLFQEFHIKNEIDYQVWFAK